MFGMAWTKPPLTSGVLANVCGQKGGHFQQLLWPYSAVWQETFQFLSNVTQFWDFFEFELVTFAR